MGLTNNRKSLPKHLAEHNAQGRHVSGIVVLDPDVDVNQLATELALVAEGRLRQSIRTRFDVFRSRDAFTVGPSYSAFFSAPSAF
jgi:hypothetical protein